MTDWLGLADGRVVVDVGAGTGKLTRELLRTGADVVAVEPVAGMREVLRAACPDAHVLDAVAEELPLADGSLDGATAGQAFHWFDTAAALSELRRVLRPPRRLALLWNSADRRVDWVRAWHERIDALADDRGPRHRSPTWLDELPGIATRHDAVVPNDQTMARQQLLARVATTSYVAALPDDERRAFLDALDAEVLADVVDDGDTVTVPTSCGVHLFELEER